MNNFKNAKLLVIFCLALWACKKESPEPPAPEPHRRLLEEVVDSNNRLCHAFTYNSNNQLTKWEYYDDWGNVERYIDYHYLQNRLIRMNYVDLFFIQDLDWEARFFYDSSSRCASYTVRTFWQGLRRFNLTYDASNKLSGIHSAVNDSLLYGFNYMNTPNCKILISREQGYNPVSNFEYDNFRRPDIGLPPLPICYPPYVFFNSHEAFLATAVSENNISTDVQKGTTWEYTYNQNLYPERVIERINHSSGPKTKIYFLRYRRLN